MFVADYNMIYQLVATFLTGIIIKLLDDYMDEELPSKLLSPETRNGILPYSLIIFSLAAALNLTYTVTLFSGAYVLGMFFHMQQKLPTGLTGLQESLIILFINLLIFPFAAVLTSLLVILFIQSIDDLLDRQWDKRMGHHNLANQFGMGEMIILSAILAVLLMMLDLKKFVFVNLCFFVINKMYKRFLLS
ncbi:hypothetical protein SAMN02745975_02334 [Geosporobacter subterraneus DSM 17957]|uniref:UbiA prenyltransferase family protein n=1 Tax=Geosporobacter subterraneus DSM 17957 TaxID=1121919 RepID=A0A1M6K6Y0_9FIRM|nr:hypothetical protein [Geosporobacter subterraneus]SHJ54721.1 hypothetical protein SAMN02745975_02334 [Geosporobacter subterraneus DSM 17957]